MVTPELLDRLDGVRVADLSDAARRTGARLPLAGRGLRPVVPFTRIVGCAVTVRAFLGAGPGDYVEHAAAVFEEGFEFARPVLVQRTEVPGWDTIGSMDARFAIANGFVGCVSDGPVRDTTSLRDLDFPVFSTAITAECVQPRELPEGRAVRFELGGPVEIGGVIVRRGDVIVGDNDGLIVIPPGRLETVLRAAEAIVRLEARMTAMLAEGHPFREVARLPLETE